MHMYIGHVENIEGKLVLSSGYEGQWVIDLLGTAVKALKGNTL